MVASLPAGRSDATAGLPPELLLKFVRGFTFDEVRPLLAVSARWREIAFNSEAYWSFIHLQRFTAPGANLFLARLARSGARPVSLTIDLRPPNADLVPLQDAVLTAVREHLCHLNWLLIHLRAEDAPKLWPSLILPAPLLDYFDLRVDLVTNTDALPVLSENVFQGQAPRLRSVAFQDVALPSAALPVFANVPKLCIQNAVTRPMTDIFQAFPSLNEAILSGWASYEHPVFSQRAAFRNIKEWTWRSGRGLHTIPFPLESLRGVYCVTLHNPQASEILGLVGQLTPPLAVGYTPDIRTPEEEFRLTVESGRGPARLLRSFIDKYRVWSHSPEPDFRRAMRAALADNVDVLYLNANGWTSFVRCIPPVSTVRWVRIFADEPDEFSTLAPAAFASPALEDLEFNGRCGCVALAQEHLFAFAQGSFDAAALRRSALTLVNVHVLGDVRAFSGVMKHIYVRHDLPCTMETLDNDWYRLPRVGSVFPFCAEDTLQTTLILLQDVPQGEEYWRIGIPTE